MAGLLLLAVSPEPMPPAPAAGDPNPQLQQYAQIDADRMWGAHLYCSPPGHQRILNRADARIHRIRDALIDRFGRAAVAAAEARRQALFDDEFSGVGAGIACRINDPAMNRQYSAGLRRHYDEMLAKLEADLGLRVH